MSAIHTQAYKSVLPVPAGAQIVRRRDRQSRDCPRRVTAVHVAGSSGYRVPEVCGTGAAALLRSQNSSLHPRADVCSRYSAQNDTWHGLFMYDVSVSAMNAHGRTPMEEGKERHRDIPGQVTLRFVAHLAATKTRSYVQKDCQHQTWEVFHR